MRMKSVVSLLVLLHCCLSGAQVHIDRDGVSVNEIQQVDYEDRESRGKDIQTDSQRAEAALTHNQQTCQPDIHTVLREMSTMMAEQRVELRHTKTELGAMEARLRASESRLTDSESRLTDSESRLTDSESRLTDSESRLTDSESRLTASESRLTDSESRLTDSERQVEELKVQLTSKVEDLSKMNEAQAVKLNSMETRSNITESHVEVLKRNSQDRKVAFSASLAAPGQGGDTGPFNTGITLVYRHIYSNIGNAYNPTTGIFTAPVRGLYLFRFYIYGEGDSSASTTAALHKNGHHVAVAHAHQATGGINSSNGVSLLLEVGDVVYMHLWVGDKIYDSEYHHSTFSGHLLFTM